MTNPILSAPRAEAGGKPHVDVYLLTELLPLLRAAASIWNALCNA